MRSPSALLLLIGCAVLFPKAALGKLSPLYVWRQPPTSSPTALPSYQPSARPSLLPSSSPSRNPASVYIENNYMTSESMEERRFGFWKTLFLISFLSCFVGVGIGMCRNHDCLQHKASQDKKQVKRETTSPANGVRDRTSEPAKDENTPFTSAWLLPFWNSEPAKDEPSLPTREDESMSADSSIFSSSFSSSFNPSSYSGSSVSSILSPLPDNDSPQDKFDVETGLTQPPSPSEATDTDHLVQQRGKKLATTVSVRGKLDQAKIRLGALGNRMKEVALAKSKQVTKSEQETKSKEEIKGNQVTKSGDQIDDSKSIATVAEKVSSAVTWGLDWIEVLAFGEEEEEEQTRPPSQVVVAKNTSSSHLNRSDVQPTPPARKDSNHKNAAKPNAAKMKTAHFKALVAQKALEMKVKAREKKWQKQQTKAAAAVSKLKELEAKAAAAESERKEQEDAQKVEIDFEREAEEIETKLRMMDLAELNTNSGVEVEEEKDIESTTSHDRKSMSSQPQSRDMYNLGTASKSEGSDAGSERTGRTLTGLKVYGSNELEFMENTSENIGVSDGNAGNAVDAIEEKSAGEYFLWLHL